jgi:glutamine amidotransferase
MDNSTHGQQNVVIVDTGCANLSSVKFAVQRLGYQALISDDVSVIDQADKVILPGVGSAIHAMSNIRAKDLQACLQQLTQPVLGFCLGMQLMAESSTEGVTSDSTVSCLGVIPVDISPLKAPNLRLPHMGWNTLSSVSEHPVLEGINSGDYFYFVHSYAAPVNQYTLASCEYGQSFSAVIGKDNFIGCQFHPERSSTSGSKIINNFLNL